MTIPLIALWLGWRYTFAVSGLLGLVWLVLWPARITRQTGIRNSAPRNARSSWTGARSSRPATEMD